MYEEVESRKAELGEGDGPGRGAVVGPAEGGGEMNWNCCCGVRPTRNRAGEGGATGDDGIEVEAGTTTGTGAGGIHSSVCIDESLSSLGGGTGALSGSTTGAGSGVGITTTSGPAETPMDS